VLDSVRQASDRARARESSRYGGNPTYWSFLRAILDQPGSSMRLLVVGIGFAALLASKGLPIALATLAIALLASATLGYVIWRRRVRPRPAAGRGKPPRAGSTEGRESP
jgi:hypothetical protein